MAHELGPELPRMREDALAAPARPTVSAVIITCEDADVIEPCLQSVAGWVDEMIVVDMHSTDGAREIAQRYGARVVDHDRLAYVEPARDFALQQATGDWILMLDPDERVSAALAAELQRLALTESADVVWIPRQQVVFGKAARSRGASDGAHPRFFRRGILRWPARVHGKPEVSHLRNAVIVRTPPDLVLLHDTWRSVPQVLDKIGRYAPHDVENLQAVGVHFSVGRMLGAALTEFLQRLFVGRAYEDGVAGLLTALYFAIYRLSIYASLWEAEGRPARFDRQVRRWGGWWRWLGTGAYACLRATRRLRHLRA